MADAAEPVATPAALPPSISAHRLIGDGHSAALLRPDGEIDWWCAPALDAPPILWSLLDPSGGASRWTGARVVEVYGRPAGPTARTDLRIDGALVESWDAVLRVGSGTVLARLVRTTGGERCAVTHELAAGGFDGPRAAWDGASAALGDVGLTVHGGSSAAASRLLRTTIEAGSEWSGVLIALGECGPLEMGAVAALMRQAEHDERDEVAAARVPRLHPERALDALAVLRACTDATTGAVVASPTTSLPEAPGHDRQFDYRYCWLRDAALAVSVAALLGERHRAERYLEFVQKEPRANGEIPPMVDVRGNDVPEEREIAGVEGWAGSRPIRVGNAASTQLQYDALGMVLEAVSVHLQTGASLDARTWALVRDIADRVATDPPKPSHGIWELREARMLVSADIGRWLALDRAIWISRGWRPFASRKAWKAARAEARDRVLAAMDDDGRLPQAYGEPGRSDASALMVPLFGMLARRDPRASKVIDRVLDDLGAGPFIYRYEPDATDGFSGREGAFVPACWWAVSALAAVGRVDEAEERLDALCAALPALMPEEVDPGTREGLGNVPLVWSHVEAARALYVLDAARRRARWGPIGLWAWRLRRYAVLRWGGAR